MINSDRGHFSCNHIKNKFYQNSSCSITFATLDAKSYLKKFRHFLLGSLRSQMLQKAGVGVSHPHRIISTNKSSSIPGLHFEIIALSMFIFSNHAWRWCTKIITPLWVYKGGVFSRCGNKVVIRINNATVNTATGQHEDFGFCHRTFRSGIREAIVSWVS